MSFECNFSLGDKVKVITIGFEGTVGSVIFHKSGEIRVRVEPDGLNKDGSPVGPEWYKAEDLTLVFSPVDK